jgi:glycolate oxidase iron-sulfur subunit
VCPVFLEINREPSVARGKLALLQESIHQNRIPSKRLIEIFSLCLLCGTCTDQCTNSVQVDNIIQRARFEIAREGGLPQYKRVAGRYVLDNPKAMRGLAKTVSSLEAILFKDVPEGSGLRLRFPLPGMDPNRRVPTLSRPFFLDEIQTRNTALSNGSKRVGLFIGCTINFIHTEIARAALRILERMDIHLIIPTDQGCCGLPSFGAGDGLAARRMALRNIDAFMAFDIDEILVLCSSCCAHLKKDVARLFEDDSNEVREKALLFSGRIREISEYLLENEWKAPKSLEDKCSREKPIRVTYHDPCHLKRGLGIVNQPRQLLRDRKNIEFVEMADADRCCGMGGLFSVDHFKLSQKILGHKLRNMEKTEAEVLVTNCMGCMLHFEEGIKGGRNQVKVHHIVEVLDGLTDNA